MTTPRADPQLEQLAVAVAQREGWAGGPPPAAHPPRTLAEERAVALRAGRTVAPRRERSPRERARRARLITVAVVALVLVICWLISPERTALALIGAGLLCLIAARRRSRRSERSGRAGGWPPGAAWGRPR